MKTTKTKKETKSKASSEPIQEVLECPICKKEFKFDENKKYIFNGKYACSWKCFLKEVRKRAAIKAENKRK